MRIFLLLFLLPIQLLASSTSVKIIFQKQANLNSMANQQIGIQSVVDTTLGFRMWGGKDSTGTVYKFLGKDRNARVTKLWADTCYSAKDTTALLIVDSIYSRKGVNLNRVTIDSIVSTNYCGTKITADTINITKELIFPTRWNDIDQFILSSAKNVGQTGAPTLTPSGDGFSRYLFAVGDSLVGTIELRHEFMENDTAHCHFHYSPSRRDVAAKHVKLSVHLKLRNIGDSLTLDTTLSKEDTIAANTGRLTHKFFEVAELKTPNLKIGALIDVCIKRIASSGGTTDTLSPFIAQFGIHRKVNSLGSHTETTK